MNQKDAVVKAVRAVLPNMVMHKDIALVMLTKDQLENIKYQIGHGILDGSIEYSKDRTNTAEVMSYARSMVMNHLKKAKELNGGQVYGGSTTASTAQKIVNPEKALSGIDMEHLPTELKEFVKTIV